MGFLFTSKCFALILLCLKNRIQAKHLSVTENLKLHSCCKSDPVRLSGCSAERTMNHAMKNNSLKISSTSHEVKAPLDSNKENISANFQPPARSAAPRLCSKLNAEN
jgi:hypothetical protein